MGIIYMFTSPSGKHYIGQTINPFNLRKSKHVCEALNPPKNKTCSPYFHAAIRKHGIEKFKETILLEVANEFLDEHETRFIKEYNSLYPNGYNLKEGGRSNHNVSEESRKRMSDSKKKLLETSPSYRKQQSINASKRKQNQTLPMYVSEIRENANLVGYRVFGHPNCPNVKKFCNKKDLDSAFVRAMEYYNSLESLISPIEIIPDITGRKRNINTMGLPKYLVEVKNRKTKQTIGYAVNGHQIGYKRKEFTGIDMDNNLENAKEHLKQLLRERLRD